MPEVLPEFFTLTTRDGRVATALSGRERQHLEADVLPRFLPLQRWFAAKDRRIDKVALTPIGELKTARHVLATLDVDVEGETQTYLLPLSALWGEENVAFGAPKLSYTLAKLRQGPRVGALVDAAHDQDFADQLLAAMRENATLRAPNGQIVFQGSDRLSALEDIGEPRPVGVEQSNLSIIYGQDLILKIYRRLRAGIQPDVEIARFLTGTAGFENTPAFLGAIEHQTADGEPTTLAAAFAFVPNQGDAWGVVTGVLRREAENFALLSTSSSEEAVAPEPFTFPLKIGGLLGQRTAELHRALATETDDPAFAVEPVGREDLEAWADDTARDLGLMIERLESARKTLDADAVALADAVLGARDAYRERIEAVRAMTPSGGQSRIHGDYHLGQVLVAQSDLMIIDFEGEPRRPLAERRKKSSPLRDVAGMLRSLDYAASAAIRQPATGLPSLGQAAEARAEQWRDETLAEFMEGYNETIRGCATYPEDEDLARGLLDLFLIQKAAYEVVYELSNRPDWVGIPLRGMSQLLQTES